MMPVGRHWGGWAVGSGQRRFHNLNPNLNQRRPGLRLGLRLRLRSYLNGSYLSSRRPRPAALQFLKARIFFGGRPASAAVACEYVLK